MVLSDVVMIADISSSREDMNALVSVNKTQALSEFE